MSLLSFSRKFKSNPFTKIAFALEQEDKDLEILSIGEKIVENYANVLYEL